MNSQVLSRRDRKKIKALGTGRKRSEEAVRTLLCLGIRTEDVLLPLRKQYVEDFLPLRCPPSTMGTPLRSQIASVPYASLARIVPTLLGSRRDSFKA